MPLLHAIRRHCPIDKESNRQHLHAIGFGGDDEIVAVDPCIYSSAPSRPKHLRQRRAENICIEDADFVAFGCKSHGKVGSDSTLAYAAFAR